MTRAEVTGECLRVNGTIKQFGLRVAEVRDCSDGGWLLVVNDTEEERERFCVRVRREDPGMHDVITSAVVRGELARRG